MKTGNVNNFSTLPAGARGVSDNIRADKLFKNSEIIRYLKGSQKNFDTLLNFSDTTLHSGTNCVVFSHIPPDIHKSLRICRCINHRMPDVPVPQIILYQTRITPQGRQRIAASVPQHMGICGNADAAQFAVTSEQ